MTSTPANRPAKLLDDSARRLQAVLDNATVAIILMDDRQHCIYMNRAAEKLTGYTLGEVLALDRPLHDIVHHTYPDGRPFPLDECAIDRAFPEHHQTQGEEVFVHKDGRFYPVAFTASPIHDDASKTIGTIIEVRDITEERAAAEKQRRLAREVDHRAKNALALVQGIVRLTQSSDPKRYAEAVQARVDVLAIAHALLSEAAWAGVSLDRLISAERSRHDEADIRAEGPDLLLPARLVQPVALVLHELMRNAFQHGSLASKRGSLTITWSVTEDVFQLEWLERGGPAPGNSRTRGYGRAIIDAIIRRQLSGRVHETWDEAGLLVRLIIPLSRGSGAQPQRVE